MYSIDGIFTFEFMNQVMQIHFLTETDFFEFTEEEHLLIRESF